MNRAVSALLNRMGKPMTGTPGFPPSRRWPLSLPRGLPATRLSLMNTAMLTSLPCHLSAQLMAGASALNERLRRLHERLLETVPQVDRIACALYDPREDRLKTFINSTRAGEAIIGSEFRMTDGRALCAMSDMGVLALDDLPKLIQSDAPHAEWRLRQGYQSAFMAPLYHNDTLLGLVFFDSVSPAAFTPFIQRDLVLYCSLIHMTIASELNAAQAILRAAAVAHDLAHMRDFETGAHLDRMACYARLIAETIAPVCGLTSEFVQHVHRFAPLHDIGKIGIPDRILLKPGRLNAEERKIMETHVEKGMSVIDRMVSDFGLYRLPESSILKNIVCCHHEYLDGSGYPAGLKGDAIPLEARIVTVADIFDALTFTRPYKRHWSIPDALAELQRMAAAGKLDSRCVAAIGQDLETLRDIATRYQDPAEPAPAVLLELSPE